MAQRHKLSGREYKLLLVMRLFPGEPSLARANMFWSEQLGPIIVRCLGRRAHNVGFKKSRTDRREVRYLDAASRILADNDYTLRERRTSDPRAPERQVTLKLRMPDQFVVAGTRLHDSEDVETKLEEDIAPLAAAADDRVDGAAIALAVPPSIRSRFALSVSQPISADRRLTRLRDALDLYPGLKAGLRAGARRPMDPDERLREGPAIREVAFKGAEVALGDDIAGRFALTLWRFRPEARRRDVTEVSFRCGFKGAMPGGAARRALALFIAMQEDLGRQRLLDLRGSSKTALALPR